jgi:hypothetical protein
MADAPAGLVRVSIDVRPWARVAVQPVGQTPAPKPGSRVTPLTLDLAPGEYELSFENGGVTQPLTRKIRVGPGTPRALRFSMPGFSASAVVDRLLTGGDR